MLSGRTEGIPLTPGGREQARALRGFLGGQGFDAVFSSPVQRAVETARAIAGTTEIEIAEALDEVDFGEWTGRSFAELDGDPDWQQWNQQRSVAVPPGGERMAAVQQRVLGHLRAVATDYPGGRVAMVSHCDVIRSAVAGILGLSLDNILRFAIDPASVTRIAAGDWGEALMSLNESAA